MEYKKSEPVNGKLNGRYATLYEYEFPRPTRLEGAFLPLGSMRLREFLFCDGGHGQLIQITCLPMEKMARGTDPREMVNKVLCLGREGKKFREGTLTSQELSGEIREYSGKRMIRLGEVLAGKEKIGAFGSAWKVQNQKLRRRRIIRWKIRLLSMSLVACFVLGGVCGVLAQKHDLLDLKENSFYHNYILPPINTISNLFH